MFTDKPIFCENRKLSFSFPSHINLIGRCLNSKVPFMVTPECKVLAGSMAITKYIYKKKSRYYKKNLFSTSWRYSTESQRPQSIKCSVKRFKSFVFKLFTGILHCVLPINVSASSTTFLGQLNNQCFFQAPFPRVVSVN